MKNITPYVLSYVAAFMATFTAGVALRWLAGYEIEQILERGSTLVFHVIFCLAFGVFGCLGYDVRKED